MARNSRKRVKNLADKYRAEMMMIPLAVIGPAKAAYFPGLDHMPGTVIGGFLRWAKEEKKDPALDNEENRVMMRKLACYARATWNF